MTKLRQLWLLTALATVAVLAGGYFLLVSPKSNEAAELRTETSEQLQVNRQLKSQIDMLNKQKKDLPAQQARLAEFASLIPNNPALPALIRSLTDAADNAGVDLQSISPTLPEYAQAVNPTTGAEVPGKVVGPDGQVLADIDVELRVHGSYSQVTQFFGEVEELNRALLVDGMTITPVKGSQASNVRVEGDRLEATIKTRVMMTRKAPVTPVKAKTTTSTTDAETK